MQLSGKAHDFTKLEDRDWLCDFAFAVDILTHINVLNAKLQEKDRFALKIYTNVKAFKSKVTLFSKQLSSNLANFPRLATYKEAAQHVTKYRKLLILYIKNSAVDSWISKDTDNYFNLFHPHCHKSL